MKKLIALLLALLCAAFAGCYYPEEPVEAEELPVYSGKPYAVVDNNIPEFTEKQKQSTKPFEKYSRLDSLGRCGEAFANVCEDTMPTEKRTSISEIKPTGWVQKEYAFVQDGHIYNRCHLIAHMLTGENANERNLITGTRYMNVQGMLPFETRVYDYVKATGNHVLYRVTPVFEDKNLLASGVEMEAWSVEDRGAGICFDVYCFNVQPGVSITYANGKNRADGTIKITGKSKTTAQKNAKKKYILNTNTMKFHRTDCPGVDSISSENKKTFKGKRSELIKKGYSPCKTCNP